MRDPLRAIVEALWRDMFTECQRRQHEIQRADEQDTLLFACALVVAVSLAILILWW